MAPSVAALRGLAGTRLMSHWEKGGGGARAAAGGGERAAERAARSEEK
jgi:hypothetical protein